jgi:hypothetical protein
MLNQGTLPEGEGCGGQSLQHFPLHLISLYCSLNKILFDVCQTFPLSELLLKVTAVCIALIVCA